MNIAFCCDKTALPGLYVSLSSLLKAQLLTDSQELLRIFIFQEGMSEKDCAGLKKTSSIHPHAELTIQSFSTAGLTNLKGLHGNFMTYARLFLADLLPEVDRLIYLDSDLLINCSLQPLWEMDLGPNLIAAVSTGTIEWSLEKYFLTSQGLEMDDPYFNAGVLLLDLARYREGNWQSRSLAFLEKYKQDCQAADETVLNALFSRTHLRLPSHYNVPALPSVPLSANNLPAAVIHFVGSPKPWDFAGGIIHGSGRIFADALRQTAFAEYSRATLKFSLRRTFLISKTYLRTLKWRLQNKNTTL
jgi:lipopolysaccharide biosynthesis glycosyltransferase